MYTRGQPTGCGPPGRKYDMGLAVPSHRIVPILPKVTTHGTEQEFIKNLVRKPERRRPLGRPQLRWEYYKS